MAPGPNRGRGGRGGYNGGQRGFESSSTSLEKSFQSLNMNDGSGYRQAGGGSYDKGREGSGPPRRHHGGGDPSGGSWGRGGGRGGYSDRPGRDFQRGDGMRPQFKPPPPRQFQRRLTSINVSTNCFRADTKKLVPTVYLYQITIVKENDVKSKDPVPAKKPKKGVPAESSALEEEDIDEENQEYFAGRDRLKSKKFRALSRLVNYKVVEQLGRTYGGRGGAFEGIQTAFDGKTNLYANKPIKNVHGSQEGEYEVEIQFEDKSKAKFIVFVRLAENGEIDMTPMKQYLEQGSGPGMNQDQLQNYVRVLDAIIKPPPKGMELPIKGALFDPQDKETVTAGDIIRIVPGVRSSARSVESGIIMMVDRPVALILKPQPVADLVRALARLYRYNNYDRDLPEGLRRRLQEILRGVQVVARHTKASKGYARKYRVNKVTKTSAARTPLKDNTGKSVYDYFSENYRDFTRSDIRHRDWPCLSVGMKEGVYIPLEACDVAENQPLTCKLTPELQSLITDDVSIPPQDRLALIKRYAKSNVITLTQRLKAFGLQINPNEDPIVVKDCPILAPPKLVYKDRQGNQKTIEAEYQGEGGEWRIQDFKEKIDLKFFQPIKFARDVWGVVNLSSIQMKELQETFFKPFMQRAKDYGITMEDSSLYIDIAHQLDNIYKSDDPVKYVATLLVNILKEKGVKKGQMKLLFVALPPPATQKDKHNLYQVIKGAGDNRLWIVTQCLNEANLRKRDQRGNVKDAYIRNLIVKDNPKAGGVNAVMELVVQEHANQAQKHLPQGTMIIGADVRHQLCSELRNSVGAVIGSIDSKLSKFASRVEILSSPEGRMSQEMIQDFDTMVLDIMDEYRKANNNNYPRALLIYRDGVSEGQFGQVEANEIAPLKRLLHEKKIPIKITYVIVTKRHHFRAFPQDPRDGLRNGNIPSGTLIDRDVVSNQYHKEFYLNSQKAIIGTAKPARYTVLFDENQLKDESFQAVTFALCCICVRCLRTISIPAPVKYADLCCYRAGDHIAAVLRRESLKRERTSQASGSGSSYLSETEREELRGLVRDELKKIDKSFQNEYYYC